MALENINPKHNWVERIANTVTKAAGSNSAIILAFFIIVIWLITGPIFNFSNLWLSIMNTGTSIITFLMVFLIQKSQNKDYLAIQIKLNELVSSHEIANNSLVNIENMSEDELQVLQKYYSKLGEKNRNNEVIEETFSTTEIEKLIEEEELKNRPSNL